MPTGYDTYDLTQAIKVLAIPPNPLEAAGAISKGNALTGPICEVSRESGVVRLLTSMARGGLSQTIDKSTQKKRYLPVPHLPGKTTIKPDELSGKLAFGKGDTLATKDMVLKDRLTELKGALSLTRFYHAANVVGNGVCYEADGATELYNLFNIWGLTRTSITLGAAPNVEVDQALDQISTKLASTGFMDTPKVIGLCSSGFYTWLSSHADVKPAIVEQNDTGQESHQLTGFRWAGVTWMRFTRANGATPIVAADSCSLVPIVPGLITEHFAPGDIMEAVGTAGLPEYVTEYELPHGAGVELRGQTNPIYICGVPEVLVKLVKGS